MLLTAAVVLFISCATTKTATSDDGPRFIANSKPLTVAKVGVSFEKLMSSEVASSELALVFHPKTNETAFDFSYQTNRTFLFLGERSRQTLIAAVSAYAAEYDARTLNVRMKRSQTRKAYGTAGARLTWGTLFQNGLAEPQISFGYIFVDKNSPYFTVFIPRTENAEGQNNEDRGDDYSIETVLYFTKSQAIALAEALKQETLLAAIPAADLPPQPDKADVYTTK